MDTICRLCTLKTQELTSIFTFKNDRLISDMITLICPIRIDPSDDYPKNICKSCLKIITDAYELREKSVYSDINFKTGKFNVNNEKVMESMDISEVTDIKQESDPFQSSIEIVDQNFPPENNDFEEKVGSVENDDYDDDNDDDFDDYETEQNDLNVSHKGKSIRVNISGEIKYKCLICHKFFSHQTNVTRHIRNDHGWKRMKSDQDSQSSSSSRSKEIGSTFCKICNAFISHKTNLKRHIKNHHSASAIKKEELQKSSSKSSDLSKKFFNTPKKQKYLEFISIISNESDNCIRYKCLLCIRDSQVSKIWTQRISNGGTSNIRRHLSTTHPVEFKTLEPCTFYSYPV